MQEQRYTTDHLGTWHVVAAVNEFKHEVRGRCGYDFEPASKLVTERPAEGSICCGCLAATEKLPSPTTDDARKTPAEAPRSNAEGEKVARVGD